MGITNPSVGGGVRSGLGDAFMDVRNRGTVPVPFDEDLALVVLALPTLLPEAADDDDNRLLRLALLGLLPLDVTEVLLDPPNEDEEDDDDDDTDDDDDDEVESTRRRNVVGVEVEEVRDVSRGVREAKEEVDDGRLRVAEVGRLVVGVDVEDRLAYDADDDLVVDPDEEDDEAERIELRVR